MFLYVVQFLLITVAVKNDVNAGLRLKKHLLKQTVICHGFNGGHHVGTASDVVVKMEMQHADAQVVVFLFLTMRDINLNLV